MNRRKEPGELPQRARLSKSRCGTVGAYIADGEVLSIHEVAARFGRTDRWVRDVLIPQGLPYRHCGTLILISGRDLRLWLESGTRSQVEVVGREGDHA